MLALLNFCAMMPFHSTTLCHMNVIVLSVCTFTMHYIPSARYAFSIFFQTIISAESFSPLSK